MRKFASGWKSRWTELQCKARSQKEAFVMESGERIEHEKIELSCPHEPPKVACEDFSW